MKSAQVKNSIRRRIVAAVVCLSLLGISQSAQADQIKDEVIGIGIGIGLTGVAIGIGVFYAIHSGRSLRGCTSGGEGGLQLLQKDDPQVWLLVGDIASIKPGERVHVAGRKKKKEKDASARRTFVVDKVAKDYGPCSTK